MSWIKKIVPSGIRNESAGKHSVPEGVWTKCSNCSAVLYQAELERSMQVCPKCNAHRTLNARARLNMFLDEDDRVEISGKIEATDPLKFRDNKKYKDRLVQTQKKTGMKDAMLVMKGRLHNMPVVVSAFEFSFMGGSMGSVVGEEFVRGVDAAVENAAPMINFSSSGGARMHESLFSLLQMAKTSAALTRLSDRNLPFISVMTNPTTGGVAASLAMLGDINVAEPGALIGFAGPRVIEQTVRQKLPEGFQRSEFLLEHGAIDMIIDRRHMRDRLSSILSMLMHQPPRTISTD